MTANHNSLDEATLMRLAGRWLRALTDGCQEVVALTDEEGHIHYLSMSGALQAMLGYDAIEFAEKSYIEVLHPDDTDRVLTTFRQLVATPDARQTAEYRVKHRDGHYVRVESTGVNRLDDEVVRAVVIHSRVKAQPVAVVQEVDPVRARISDRATFLTAVTEAIGRTEDQSGYGFSVLMLELERFKMLVGNYGQEVADQVLAEVARRLVALLRPSDMLCQLSGGEFAILLDAAGDRRQAGRISERIDKTVGSRFNIGGQTITTSTIIGIATSERLYERAEHVLRDAALAANRARERGRRRRAIFQTQMRVEDTRYLSLVGELHGALQEDQLRVHYQPIVSLATRTLAGFEALVRWQHPTRGVISPAEFIPLAEETGLIIPMGRWIMKQSCLQMAHWHTACPTDPPLYISVNLSPKQFADEELQKHVEEVLRETGLDAHQLKLEITESAVLENQEAAAKVLSALKTGGVKVSLDDFGTGYSSFSHLYQLPYDTLKIDRSFVARIGEGGENSEIIHAIIVLAHNLRMEVVAEGVETAAQAAQLRNMWCEYAQGYYFAKPMDANAAGTLLASRPQW